MKKIKPFGSESTKVQFKDERLGPFFYLCGLMGHVDELCGKLLTLENDDRVRSWRPKQRAKTRKSTTSVAKKDWKQPGGPSDTNANINCTNSCDAIIANQNQDNHSLFMVVFFFLKKKVSNFPLPSISITMPNQ